MSVRPLSTDLQNKAESELKEVASRVQEDIQHIRNWLSQQQHLQSRTDDQWILTFLRGCKFSLQKTKDKLDIFYSMRSLMPEIYTNRDPLLPEIQEILKLGLCLPLLKTHNSTGPRVVIIRGEPIDPTKILFVNIVKTSFMIIDILLNEDDNFIVAGQHGLIDFKGTTLSHILHVDLSVVKKAAICLQQGYPTRPKGFHCLHATSYLEIILNIIKPLLTEKLRNRIKVHGNTTDNRFQSDIPPTILPKEYGGSGASMDELIDYWKKKVESYRDWFLEDARYGADETKRIGKRKTSASLFGMVGLFRKLNVD